MVPAREAGCKRSGEFAGRGRKRPRSLDRKHERKMHWRANRTHSRSLEATYELELGGGGLLFT
jgi:hypothetical protein